MKNLNVAITGYYGTGSSAVLGLLKESNLSNHINFEQPEYEHTIFYMNNALFSLGNYILSSASPLEIEASISDFKKAMENLYQNDYGWFGSYKKYLGEDFMKITDNFISSISVNSNARDINFYKGTKFSIFKFFIQIAAKIVYKRKIHSYGRKYIFEKRDFYTLTVNKSQFIDAAKKFTRSYFEICSKNNPNYINLYDHLLFPQNQHLLSLYFDDNTKLIIVQRDPRDLFILNKYFWSNSTTNIGYSLLPVNPQEFIEYWKLNIVEPSIISDKNVCIIQFEDLIYKKNRTKKQLCEFLNIDENSFDKEYVYFDEKKSIKNTQTFLVKKEWEKEVKIIEKELKEYIYNFPFINNTNVTEFFD